MSTNNFQQYAEECLRSARDAKNDEQRKVFLDMARTWAEAAQHEVKRAAQELQPEAKKA